ncbi:MAG: hypothetical protein PHX34_02005 [Candidatus Shapirobacteria bacterium]|nr:hypothetical protein [Candidatus Shapirobacteria bacterium]
MKENRLIKFLIPLIAAVVVFESIVLVTSLEKNAKTNSDNNSATESAQAIDEVVEEPVMEFVFSTDTKEMKVGKTYKVTLNLLPKETKVIDSIETYISYDKDNFKVANLVSDSGLQKPYKSKIDSENGVIENMILIDNGDKSGLSMESGVLVPVLTFNVTPKTEGNYVFKLSDGNQNKDYTTLVVENETAKPLNWNGNELDVNVIK